MCEVPFSLLPSSNLSACSILDWLMNSQSEFEWIAYRHHWIFKISMVTCPISVHTLILASSISHACWVWQCRIWGLSLSFHNLSRKYSISRSAQYCCVLCFVNQKAQNTNSVDLNTTQLFHFVTFYSVASRNPTDLHTIVVCHLCSKGILLPSYATCFTALSYGNLSVPLHIFSAWQLG